MDGSYAPQSPDLSSFFSSPSQAQQQQQQQQQQYQPTHSTATYAPRSPVIPSHNSVSSQPRQHQLFQHSQYQAHPSSPPSFDRGAGGGKWSECGANTYMSAIPNLPPAHSSFGAAPKPSPYFPSQQQQRQTLKTEDSYEHKNRPSFDADGDSDYAPSPTMSSLGPPKVQTQFQSSSSLASAPPQPKPYKDPNPHNIEIKTKFPVARIKRIMQADEEVGKVAQVTPVAVSKALELFMIALVGGAAEKAREKGGKRVTAQHLKMVVEGDEQFDFLNDIVAKVADVQEGAGGHKRKVETKESESEEEKKETKRKPRRKKTD